MNSDAPRAQADENPHESAKQSPDEDHAPSDGDDATTESDAEKIKSRQVALYRSGILKKGGSKKQHQVSEKKTSVFDRRVGSATKLRRGIRRTSTQLVDAVKQRA